jgi:heat shock protein HtpX
MKRIFLFLITNIAVMFLIGILVNILGLNGFLTQKGLNLPMLLGFSAVVGFSGSIISLLMSKMMAKWSTGARIINNPQNADEQWLVHTVQKLASSASISMPEVAIYDGEPNAFATGASKNNSLVAVSTGLLYSMSKREVEGVLAHEIAHVANGDMVTLTLVQGVVNTFVVFLSRIVGYAVDGFLRKNDDNTPLGSGFGYHITVFACQIIFGMFASIIVMWFSRHREFKADAGAAKIMNDREPMIAALQKLIQLQTGTLPNGMSSCGIAAGEQGKFNFMELFTTHPPLQKRIEALRNLQNI